MPRALGAACLALGLVCTPLAGAQIAGLPVRLLPPPPSKGQDIASRADPDARPLPLSDLHVRVTSPRHGQQVAGRVEITAEVLTERPEAVLFVEFEVDGRVLFADAHAPYELIWKTPLHTSHRIVARAFGPTGEMAQDVVRTSPPPAVERAVAFTSRSERVEVYVRLERDEPASLLHETDFTVLENGVEQPIVQLDRTVDLPLAIGLMVDCSGSMVERLGVALDAADNFIEGLITQRHDKAFVMSFADLPSLLQEFTNDVGRLGDSLQLISGGRYTKLYDSIVSATAQFQGHTGRRALVLLTDGHDANSRTRLSGAIAEAQRHDVAIYPVAIDIGPRFFHERWVLRKLAEETGGRVMHLERLDDPERIYAQIAEDLRAQYRISYAPVIPGGSGEWRGIEVRLADAAQMRDVRVRARPGYFAH